MMLNQEEEKQESGTSTQGTGGTAPLDKQIQTWYWGQQDMTQPHRARIPNKEGPQRVRGANPASDECHLQNNTKAQGKEH